MYEKSLQYQSKLYNPLKKSDRLNKVHVPQTVLDNNRH